MHGALSYIPVLIRKVHERRVRTHGVLTFVAAARRELDQLRQELAEAESSLRSGVRSRVELLRVGRIRQHGARELARLEASLSELEKFCRDAQLAHLRRAGYYYDSAELAWRDRKKSLLEAA